MQENFLHFIWQFQYFDQQALRLRSTESLLVLRQGMYNRQDAGPDFKGAHVKIGQLDWYGDVEIHLRSSDWQRHHHERNAAYNSVVLHVVWEDDGQVKREDGSIMPVLVLKDRVDKSLLSSYERLLESHYAIACAPQFSQTAVLSRVSMLDNALMQRLKRKSTRLIEWVEEAKGDWETVSWWLLAQNFGFKKNNDPFLRLGRALPLKVLAKHRSDKRQLEALLYGMAGFLEDPKAVEEPYRQKLQQEWAFLRQKYAFGDQQLRLQEWQFLRMRPANFPSLRLAQLAAIIGRQHHLFSLFSSQQPVPEMISLLRSPQSVYWQRHYNFGKGSAQKLPVLGLSSAQNLLINTAVPLLAAYGVYTDDESWIDRAMELLQQLPAESNRLMDDWKDLGMKAQHAYDSQALIELHNEFCQPRKCLQCVLGLDLLKRRLL